ncbi:MAG: hypothetical protein UZ13_02076 [Chloroflexi bacterium OLB13]|nr:MAG: hypothetical protein UZ13_02076 [Chloroflexi bacterium OLB13]
MKLYRTMDESLALCDYRRARRTEPTTKLHSLTREQQAAFWRRAPLLSTWLGSWRESRR